MEIIKIIPDKNTIARQSGIDKEGNYYIDFEVDLEIDFELDLEVPKPYILRGSEYS